MPYAYASVDVIKGTSVLSVTGTAHDTRLRLLAEAVSREADGYCNRTFQPRTDTLFFDGNGKDAMLVPDLVSVTSLVEDDQLDGTFDVTWDAADYVLYPLNANPTSTADARPYWEVQVSDKSNGTQDVFLRGQRNYRIVGTWGYSSVTVISGLNASGSWDSTATALNVSGSVANTLEPGMTILVDTEQLYVRSSTGTAITVTRGVNGAAAGTHGSGSAIRVYQYPEPVREAVIMQVGRLFKRAQSAFANETGAPDGSVTVFRGALDPDVRMLLSPFRMIPMGGGNG